LGVLHVCGAVLLKHFKADNVNIINDGEFEFQIGDPFHGKDGVCHPTTFGKTPQRFDWILFDKRLGSLARFWRLKEERLFDYTPKKSKSPKKDVVDPKKRVSDHMLIAVEIDLQRKVDLETMLEKLDTSDPELQQKYVDLKNCKSTVDEQASEDYYEAFISKIKGQEGKK
jgi:hypothetical protein